MLVTLGLMLATQRDSCNSVCNTKCANEVIYRLEKKFGLKYIIIVKLQYSNYNYLYNVEIIFNTQLTLDLVHENLASTDYHERDFQDLSMIGN